MRLTWKKAAALLLGVLLCAMLVPSALAAEGEAFTEVTAEAADWDGPSNDELFDAYLRGMFYGQAAPLIKSPGSLAEKLGPVNYAIEQRMKAEIEKVAAGERTNTKFAIDVSDLDVAGYDREQLSVLYSALLVDCTSSLYWHDVRLGYSAMYNQDRTTLWVGDGSLHISLKVAVDYRGDVYEVDPAQINRAKTAKANTESILAQYASASDANKLRGYMYEICRRNVYNDDAAKPENSTDPSYGIDPWQLIYVFDDDPATNVVCEGYSKAFEYLCDNTAFSSSLISCYCVCGDSHMWNIVRMDDGNNYVVDATWSDSDDSAGTDYAMFLSYALSGSVQNGYRLTFGSTTTFRTYYLAGSSSGKNMLETYTEAELTISDHAYAGPHTHIADEPVQENIVPAACTVAGSYDEVAYCSICGIEMSRTSKAIEPLGHDDGEPAAENVVEPTCTQPGRHDAVLYCGRCGEELSRTEVTDPALGHSEGEPVEEPGVEPTCTEPGYHYMVTCCTRCGEETARTQVTDPALGHLEGEPTEEPGVEPTCTEPGYHYMVTCCTRCGEELSRTEIPDPALGHIEGEPAEENRIPATAEAEGGYDMVTYCTRCGAALTREHHVIPVITPPVITGHPQSQIVAEGKTASFTVEAQGEELQYQWQVLLPGNDDWTDMAGQTGPTHSFTASAGQSGSRYRCRVRNAAGEEISDEAVLKVVTKPRITTQPKAASVKAGKKVTFKVKATGGELKYQWYYLKPKTSKWVKMGGKAKATLSFTAAKSKNGYKYRCYVTNKAGTVKSKAVKLTVK